MASVREARLDAAVAQGLLPANFTTDDDTAGKYYSGAADLATNARGVRSGSAVSVYGDIADTLNTVAGISSANSALSNQYAREQREWAANQAAIANSFNASEAAKNRNWQEYMSNTAHQREVKDLIAAGLNPVLSATGGQGASVTSGATASANMPSGGQGQVDNSSNATIASLLGAFLSAQTQLQMMDTSARVNESVADKYTSMSKLTAEIAAAASMRNAGVSAEASKYAAGLAAEASKYSSDMAYKLKQDFPDSFLQILNSMMHDGNVTYKGLADSAVGKLLELFGFSFSGGSRAGSFGSGRSGSFGGNP